MVQIPHDFNIWLYGCGKNIFSEEVNLLEKTRPMICTLNECKSDCDTLPGKYDIITYNKLIRK